MGVTKISKIIAGDTRNEKELKELWQKRAKQNLMTNGHKAFGEPGCPTCGYPTEYGLTVTGRRAWFCTNGKCRFFDTAVVAVVAGITDTLEHYRNKLWHDRFNEPFKPFDTAFRPSDKPSPTTSHVQWKVRMG